MKHKKYLHLFILVFVLLALPAMLHAQPPGPDPTCNPDDPCPIDTGTIYLILAAIGIALYKVVPSKFKLAK
jgi:hypothetical protein